MQSRYGPNSDLGFLIFDRDLCHESINLLDQAFLTPKKSSILSNAILAVRTPAPAICYSNMQNASQPNNATTKPTPCPEA